MPWFGGNRSPKLCIQIKKIQNSWNFIKFGRLYASVVLEPRQKGFMLWLVGQTRHESSLKLQNCHCI